MEKNVKRKMPITTIVVGVLFFGMLGTTIYSVGEIQKLKREQSPQSDEVQIVEIEKEAPVQIVEVEKDCPVPDDSFKRELKTLLWNNSKALNESSSALTNAAVALSQAGLYVRRTGSREMAIKIMDISTSLSELALQQVQVASIHSARSFQLKVRED